MSHEHISPTAWLIAYERTLSDIPLSSEIFREIEKIIGPGQTSFDVAGIDALKVPQMAVTWESRFKIINHVLKLHHANQVLELAAGFSPRGLSMAKDTSVTYVEVDLPGLVQDKHQIIETLIDQGRLPVLPNFHLLAGNALNLPDLLAAARFFSDAPVAIVNEGLLPYLNRAERTTLAQNVHSLLERFGGVWITPDIEIPLPEGTIVKARTEQVETITGVDLLKNRFENEEAARVFFENLGFQIERHRFMEVADQLVSVSPPPLAQKMLEQSVLYAMTVKP
jgi:O-methyltransferase involved in polyketide biosynthesis